MCLVNTLFRLLVLRHYGWSSKAFHSNHEDNQLWNNMIWLYQNYLSLGEVAISEAVIVVHGNICVTGSLQRHSTPCTAELNTRLCTEHTLHLKICISSRNTCCWSAWQGNNTPVIKLADGNRSSTTWLSESSSFTSWHVAFLCCQPLDMQDVVWIQV